MRVLHVTVNGQFGGREVIVRLLARHLLEAGVEVAVAGVEGACRDAFEAAQVPVLGGGLGQLDRRPGAWLQLRRYLREYQPDVLHGWESEIVVPTRVLGWLEGVPARVSTVLTPWVLRWKASLRRRLYLAALFAGERLTQGLDHEVVAISDAIRDDYQGRGLRASTIYPTVETRRPRTLDVTVEFGVPPGRSLLVATGRAVDRKGLPDLIEVMRRLRDEGRDVHLLHLGDDPTGGSNRERYRRMAADAGVADAITLVPRWDGEVVDLLGAAQVAVLPTYSEGLGLLLVEALLAEVPAVAYAVGGTVDVIDDGHTGWLAPLGDRAAFAACVGRALDLDQPGRERLAAAARARHRARFRVEDYVAAHRELYAAALDAAP